MSVLGVLVAVAALALRVTRPCGAARSTCWSCRTRRSGRPTPEPFGTGHRPRPRLDRPPHADLCRLATVARIAGARRRLVKEGDAASRTLLRRMADDPTLHPAARRQAAALTVRGGPEGVPAMRAIADDPTVDPVPRDQAAELLR
jgi:hypothetical protein